MLMLIGLGLETKDLSVRALEALKSADRVLAEQYTTILPGGYIDFLEKETGKRIQFIKRSDLEENVDATIKDSKTKNIALLIPGDPLVATTHHIVADAAKKVGASVEVFHSSSIFSAAIGVSGLDIYRFGPTTTVPFWSAKYKPTSFLDVIMKNQSNGQHTLVLLDIDAAEGRHMNASEAVALLLKAEEEKGYGVLTPDTRVIVLCDIGRNIQAIDYTTIGKATSDRAKATALIIPARLNFAEEESLRANSLK